jgi:hypothetical protein
MKCGPTTLKVQVNVMTQLSENSRLTADFQPKDADEQKGQTPSCSLDYSPNPAVCSNANGKDPADGDKDRPVVESWIADDLNKRGLAKFTAATGWVPLDLSPIAGTDVWDGKLGDKQLYCGVAADIPDRAEGRIKVLLHGWGPAYAEVTVSLTDEPGSRAIAAVEAMKRERGMPYVAVLIGPPYEELAAATDPPK